MTTTANQELFDALIRHQMNLMQLSNTTRNKVIKILNSTEQEIAEKIRERLRNSHGLNSPTELKRLETLLGIIKNIKGKAWEQVDEVWLKELTELAQAEPKFLQSIISTTAPAVVDTILPSARLLTAIVNSTPFEGRTLKEWSKDLQSEDLRRIENQIRLGMVSGETSAQIARRVVGSAKTKGADGVTEITRRQSAAITRTATNHIANQARNSFMLENSDLFTEEQYVATLDSNTTAICRSLDGKIFDIGTGPIPPLHFKCRSLRVPVIDGVAMGNRPMKTSTEKQILREFREKKGINFALRRDALPHGTKGEFDAFSRKRVRELTGRVPASTNYQQWLETQSVQFQEDTLGVTKAKLFREGGLKLDKFVSKTGDELNLSELAQKEAAAFKAAGLDVSEY